MYHRYTQMLRITFSAAISKLEHDISTQVLLYSSKYVPQETQKKSRSSQILAENATKLLEQLNQNILGQATHTHVR